MKVVATHKPKTDEFTRAFALRLRELRQHRKWTQKELAGRVGVMRSMILYYEGGFHHPPLPTLQKLAKVFGVSVDYLLNGAPPQQEDLQDRELFEFLTKLDKLDFRMRNAVKEIIHGLTSREQATDKQPDGKAARLSS